MRSGKRIQTMGTKLTKASTALANLRTGFAAAVMTRGLMDAVSVTIEFEKAMNAVEARGKTTAGQLVQIRKRALELGRTTKFTAVQVAQGMEMLRKRGFDVKDTLGLIGPVVTMATAGNMDLAESAERLTGILKMTGKDIDQASKVTDIFAISSSRSALSMDELYKGLLNFLPLGRAAGMEFEEMAAMVSAFSEGGVMGSKAGTLLMNVVRGLLKPTKDLGRVMRKFKIPKDPFIDASGNIKDLNGLLEELKKKGVAAADIFKMMQIRGAKGTAVMIEHTDKVKELVEEYKNATGAAVKMADIMNKGIVRAAFESSSAWQGMKIAIIKAIMPIIIGIMRMVEAFAEFVSKRPAVAEFIGVFLVAGAILLGLITTIGVVIAALGSLLVLSGFLTGGMFGGGIGMAAGTVVKGSLSGLSAVMLVLAGKVAILTAGVLLVVAAIAMVVTQWDKLTGWVGKGFSNIAEYTKKGSFDWFMGQQGQLFGPNPRDLTFLDQVSQPVTQKVETEVKGEITVKAAGGAEAAAASKSDGLSFNVAPTGGYDYSSMAALGM